MTENKEKIKVSFEGGESRDPFKGSCNYMLATTTDDEGDEVELYAEESIKGTRFDCDEHEDFDFDGFDDYSYPILKAEITRQAIEAGIDPARLEFFWGRNPPTRK